MNYLMEEIHYNLKTNTKGNIDVKSIDKTGDTLI